MQYFSSFIKFRQFSSKSIFSSRRPVFIMSSVFRQKRNHLEPKHVLRSTSATFRPRQIEVMQLKLKPKATRKLFSLYRPLSSPVTSAKYSSKYSVRISRSQATNNRTAQPCSRSTFSRFISQLGPAGLDGTQTRQNHSVAIITAAPQASRLRYIS